jgi:hypothetical protein
MWETESNSFFKINNILFDNLFYYIKIKIPINS